MKLKKTISKISVADNEFINIEININKKYKEIIRICGTEFNNNKFNILSKYLTYCVEDFFINGNDFVLSLYKK